MSEIEKAPGWMRALEIILGLLAIIFGILVIIAPLYLTTIVWSLLFAIGLFILGIVLIFRGLTRTGRSMGFRILNILFGILLMVFAIVGIIYGDPVVFALLLVWIFGIAMLADSIIGFIWAFGSVKFSMTQRVFIIIVSIIEGILSLFVLAIPYFGWIIFHIVAAIALIFAGIKYIVAGVFGDVYKPKLPKVPPEE